VWESPTPRTREIGADDTDRKVTSLMALPPTTGSARRTPPQPPSPPHGRRGPHARRRAHGLIGILAAASLALSACGGASSGQGSVADLQNEKLAEKIPADTTLRIADQQEQQQVALKSSGELDKFDFNAEFSNFVGGPEILEAFRADAVDVARVGDTPPIHAFASGEVVPIILAFRSNPDSVRLATSPNTNVHSTSQLKGAKIAYAEGTAQGSIVLKLLKKEGLSTDDVELVRLELAEFSEALQSDAVDIAPLTGARLARYLDGYEDKGAAYLPDKETSGLGTGLNFIYARKEALEDPAKAAALRSYVEHSIKASQWIDKNTDQWVQDYFVDNQGVSEKDGYFIRKQEGQTVFPTLDDVVDDEQNTIDVSFDAGELPVEVDADEMVDRRFDDVIANTVDEIGAHQTREELDE
jgi:sulfonate transport system substrate-binding protein